MTVSQLVCSQPTPAPRTMPVSGKVFHVLARRDMLPSAAQPCDKAPEGQEAARVPKACGAAGTRTLAVILAVADLQGAIKAKEDLRRCTTGLRFMPGAAGSAQQPCTALRQGSFGFNVSCCAAQAYAAYRVNARRGTRCAPAASRAGTHHLWLCAIAFGEGVLNVAGCISRGVAGHDVRCLQNILHAQMAMLGSYVEVYAMCCLQQFVHFTCLLGSNKC